MLTERRGKMVPFLSCGRIVRDLLKGNLTAGLVPMEIFIAEIFALPGERQNWQIELFIHPGAMEMGVTDALWKVIQPAARRHTSPRWPTKLNIGIESQKSLTRHQFFAWLHRNAPDPQNIAVQFSMLPMDLMLHGAKAGKIDAFIAPTPWAAHASFLGIAHVDEDFNSEPYPQKLIMVRRRGAENSFPNIEKVPMHLKFARMLLEEEDQLKLAVETMNSLGKPNLRSAEYLKCQVIHSQGAAACDTVANRSLLVEALLELEKVRSLPRSLKANEVTAGWLCGE